MNLPSWSIEEMTGYTPQTTFYNDFSIADRFGIEAIKDTFNRVFNEWHDDHIYLTELVMVLNWKIWEHYEHNKPIAQVYQELFEKADEYAVNNLHGEELAYFYRTTD